MNRNKVFVSAGVFAITLTAGPVWAQQNQNGDEQRGLHATITGNQEQPQVLYLVPWKAAQNDGAVPHRPIRGQTDTVFRHIERSEHLRHLEFLDGLAEAD